MNTDEIVESKNRWSKPLTIGLIVVTVIASIFGVGYSKTDLGDAAKTYTENKEKAEKAGLFFSADPVKAMYSVPESENGAALVKDVLTVPRQNKWDDSKKLTEKMVLDKRDVFESALKKLEEASKRPYLIFTRDLSNPAMILYPQFADGKTWIKLLTSMAQFARERGDSKAAYRYLDIAAYLSNAMDDEGILIGSLVRIAGATIIEAELAKIIETRGRQPEWQAVLENTLRRLDQPYDMKKNLQLEHWFAVTSVDLFMKDPQAMYGNVGGNSMPTALKYAKYIPRFREGNLSRIHEAYTTAVTSLPADPYDIQAVKKAYGTMDEKTSRQGFSYMMLGILAPVYSQAVFAVAKESAYRNVLFQSLAAIKDGKSYKGGLPLTDRHRLDLDSNNLRVKNVKGQWLIYSIGADKTDDGGTEMKNQKGDWVIHLPKE